MTEDAEPKPRRRAWTVVLPAVIVVAAAGVAWRSAERTADHQPNPSSAPVATATTIAPLSIAAADAVTYPTIEAMADASDVVVRGRVTEVRRGRVVGAPGAGIESRVVVVAVEHTFRGTAPKSAPLLIEEEGWLDDGTPIAVNGVPSLQPGDEAIWFLRATADPELSAHVTVSSQGRFQILPGDLVRGGAPTDPLTRAVESAGLPALLSPLGA